MEGFGGEERLGKLWSCRQYVAYLELSEGSVQSRSGQDYERGPWGGKIHFTQEPAPARFLEWEDALRRPKPSYAPSTKENIIAEWPEGSKG